MREEEQGRREREKGRRGEEKGRRGEDEQSGGMGGIYSNISDGISDGNYLLSVQLISVGNSVGN